MVPSETEASHEQIIAETEPRREQIIAEEEALYEKVREHLTHALMQSTFAIDFDADLVALRDQIAEARLEDVAPLVEQMYRTAALASQRGRGKAPPPDPQSPYFGHMVLSEENKKREVLLGKRSHIDKESGVVIVDWRNAPISQLFYRYQEGDSYEEQLAKKSVVGDILVRRTLSIVAGKLRRISGPDQTFVRKIDGEWVEVDGAAAILSGGQRSSVRPTPGVGKRGKHDSHRHQQQDMRRLGVNDQGFLTPDKHLREITPLIDPVQFDLITRAVDQPLIINGGAGSGKTTVALHRIAYLHFSDPGRFRPKHMLVVVPQRGLVEYTALVLPSLDVAGVDVQSFTSWARRTRQRMMPTLKLKPSNEIPDRVAQVKKHPAMLDLIDQHVTAQSDAILHELQQALINSTDQYAVLNAFGNSDKTPLVTRISHAREVAYRLGGRTRDAVVKVLALAQRRAKDIVADWAEVLTNKTALRAAMTQAEAPVSEQHIDESVRYVLQQIAEPEESLENYDPDRRRAIDGRDEDDGVARSLDPCDEAILLRLWQVKFGGLTTEGGHPIRYDHIAIDEAQDFSAIQLRVLMDACRNRAVSLAGDMAQKVFFDNGFDSWEGLLKAARAGDARVETLRLSYRSTREIMDVAHHLLGPLAPAELPTCPRTGVPVTFFQYSETGEAVAQLAEALRSLLARERAANVAVLSRFKAQADIVFEGLKRSEVPRLRRVIAGDFGFTPGVDVTDVASAKGLEYDYVILVDVDASTYPENIECRHLLHVAVTRAVHQLWITCSSEPSPLIAKWVREQGLQV